MVVGSNRKSHICSSLKLFLFVFQIISSCLCPSALIDNNLLVNREAYPVNFTAAGTGGDNRIRRFKDWGVADS